MPECRVKCTSVYINFTVTFFLSFHEINSKMLSNVNQFLPQRYSTEIAAPTKVQFRTSKLLHLGITKNLQQLLYITVCTLWSTYHSCSLLVSLCQNLLNISMRYSCSRRQQLSSTCRWNIQAYWAMFLSFLHMLKTLNSNIIEKCFF